LYAPLELVRPRGLAAAGVALRLQVPGGTGGEAAARANKNPLGGRWRRGRFEASCRRQTNPRLRRRRVRWRMVLRSQTLWRRAPGPDPKPLAPNGWKLRRLRDARQGL